MMALILALQAKSTGADMWAHIGILPPSYECPDCDWQERIVLKATNKKLSVREVELIREAMDEKDDAQNRSIHWNIFQRPTGSPKL